MSYKNFYKKPTEPVRKKRPAKPTRQRIGDYQLFVGAFPTGELADRLQQIREELHGTTAIVAPHVTLAGTYWRNGKPTRAGTKLSAANKRAITLGAENKRRTVKPVTLKTPPWETDRK